MGARLVPLLACVWWLVLPIAAAGQASLPQAGQSFAVECVPHSYPQRTDQSLAIDPANHDVVYVGVEGEGYFKSQDGGATWRRITNGIKAYARRGGGRCYSEFFTTVVDPQDPGHVCFAMAGSPGTMDMPTSANEGVYCSDDGGEAWVQRVQPGMNTAIYSLDIDPTNSDVLYAGSNANAASFTGADQSVLFNASGIVYKSTDGGDTWTSQKAGLGELPKDQAIFRLDLSPRDPRRVLVAISDTSYFLSVDGAETFERPRARTPNTGIFQFDPADASGRRLVGLSQVGSDLVESVDGGATWFAIGRLPEETLNNGDPARPTGVRLSDVELSRQNPRVVYLSGSHGSVYRSADGGRTWTKVLSAATLPPEDGR